MRYDQLMKYSHRWVFDLFALATLGIFGWTIHYTGRGAADPVWSDVQQRGVLRVGTDPGFRPFASEGQGRLRGYDIDLATEVAQRLQVKVEFIPIGYDALYDALSTRRVDLLAAALPIAPEQGWRARFSTAYLNAGQVLVVRRGAQIANEGELAGREVGVALGSPGDTLARKLRRTIPALTVRSVYETPFDALDALQNEQLDAVITDTVSALAALHDQSELTIARALTFEPYVLAVPANAYQLQHEVDRALEQMRREGIFDRLNGYWFQPAELHTP